MSDTPRAPSQDYKPRNDFVIVRRETVDTIKGLYMPEQAAQGKRWCVVAVGPKVEDLKPGDYVLMIGSSQEQNWMPLPEDQDLLITRESNVVLKYKFNPTPARN
jgi:hypothetical protein